MRTIKRRNFLKETFLGASFLSASGGWLFPLRASAAHAEPRAITSGDRQHWFGYYDKWQIDPSGRYALGGSVEIFSAHPHPRTYWKSG